MKNKRYVANNKKFRAIRWQNLFFGVIMKIHRVIRRTRDKKIFLKKSWRRMGHMILYQSCVWTRQTTVCKDSSQRTALSEPWQINSNATLKILKKKFQKFRRTKHLRRHQKDVTDKKSQKVLLSRNKHLNLNLRVWSWLRMNAGGVLNTCKSNGDI